jgi:hypothetical protein
MLCPGGRSVDDSRRGSEEAWFDRVRETEESLRRIADIVRTLSAALDELLPE